MSEDKDSLLVNTHVNSSAAADSLDNITSLPVPLPDDNELRPAAKFPQIWAALTATLSALSAGLVLGWTSPTFDYLTSGKFNNISVDKNQMGWIGSFTTLGAMAMCIPTGFICDLIGRKNSLLLLTVPFAVGWALIIWANSIVSLYFGRLINGMAVGASCVAGPLYCGEIAHQSLRGALGSFFQLMIVTGIFIAYVFGVFLTPYEFTKFCALVPFLFLVLFTFQPETPNYLIKKGDYEKAKISLAKLRGSGYDVEAEFIQIEGSIKERVQSMTSLRHTFAQKAIVKGVAISFALMFFQQFSGINVIILYSSDVFKSANINLNSNVATIIVGGMLATSTLFASLVIERVGRKLLLLISLAAGAVSCAVIAIYFSVKNRSHSEPEMFKEIGFIPVIGVCLFVVAFSLGLGPIPWMITSEILPTEIRSMVSSAAGTLNWFLAFVIVKSYLGLSHALGDDSMFYIFSVVSVFGTLFVLLIIPETKGKSVSQIQQELGIQA